MRYTYDSDFLKHIKTENLKKELLAYISKDDRLSYEFIGVNRDFIFITGYNEEEKTLAPFEHPILLDGLIGKEYIVVDLRKYMKSIKDQLVKLDGNFSKHSQAMFCINRAIMIDIMLGDDSTKIQYIQNNVTTIFGYMVGTYISTMINLSPLEKLNVEAAGYVYAQTLFMENYKTQERASVIKSKLSNVKLSLPMPKQSIGEMLELNMSIERGPEVLIENIKYLLGTKGESLSYRAFLNSLTSLWYGPGEMETTLLHLEDPSTMVALYYTAYEDKTFNKSNIARIINNINRKIEKDKFRNLNLMLQSYSH